MQHQNRFAGVNHRPLQRIIPRIIGRFVPSGSGGEQADVGTLQSDRITHVHGRSDGIERTIFPHGIPLRCRERLPSGIESRQRLPHEILCCLADAHLHIRAWKARRNSSQIMYSAALLCNPAVDLRDLFQRQNRPITVGLQPVFRRRRISPDRWIRMHGNRHRQNGCCAQVYDISDQSEGLRHVPAPRAAR